jgi:predicted Zn-dependent protease
MNLPDPPDLHRLRAAQGWLELGLPREAEDELSGMRESVRDHPAALEIGWAAAAAQAHWERAFVLGDRLVARDPTLVSAWIHRAYAARRMPGGGLERALAALLPAARQFPEEPMVAYNLACYLIRLGRIEEGWRWYAEAEVRGDQALIRKQALKDDDLRELWGRIRDLG